MADDEQENEMTDPIEVDAVETTPATAETPAPEPEPAEVVHLPDRYTGGADAAIEAAANAALAEPGAPGRDEFLAMAQMARVLSMSDLAPKALRGKPANAFYLLLTARSLNIDATAALRKVNIIDGQPSIAPQLLAALIQRHRLGRIAPHELRPDRAEVVCLGPDGARLGPVISFTWQDAQRVRKESGAPALVDERCAGPDEHAANCRCKTNWRNYPANMLWWRAVSKAADIYYPQVSLGLYSPDELGAMTDDSGNLVDPATAELPPGYEQPAGARGNRATGTEPAEPGDVDWLERVLVGLGECPLRGQVKARWAESIGPVPPDQLDARQARMAMSLVRGMVKPTVTPNGETADEIVARVEAAEAAGESGEPTTESGEEPEPEPEPEPDGPTAPQPSPAPPDEPESDAETGSGPDAGPEPARPGGDAGAADPGDEPDGDDPPDELIVLAMEWAGRLKGAQVDRELRRYDLPMTGRVEERQSRLATHVIDLWRDAYDAHQRGEHGTASAGDGCPVCEAPF